MNTQYTSTSTYDEEEYREVYKSDSWKYNKRYITTNPELIKKIDKINKFNKVEDIILTIFKVALIFLLPVFILYECEQWIPATIIMLTLIIGGTITAIVFCTLDCKMDNLYYSVIAEYEGSDEFRNIYQAIEKEEQEAKDKHLEEIAKDLVESYAILESEKYGKAKKIQLLKKYIERSENRREH